MLLSASEQHPDGLANSSGFVGRNLMFNAHASANAVFEHQLNEYKGVQASRVLHDFYETDEKRGFYGGGGIDACSLWSATPIFHALLGMPPDVPGWGKAVRISLEEDAFFDGDNTYYIDGRQKEFLLIPRVAPVQ